MTIARKSLISVADTPYYHVINRCVRRAFLCGVDDYTGKDYSHRKSWLVERINNVQNAFCIDVCAYAVMSNHYHLVLFIDQEKQLSNREVVKRWGLLFILPDYIQDWMKGLQLSKVDNLKLMQKIKRWRKRLYSISWFMKCINESIARQANAEDRVTGRFWQGRYFSQALLDEKALLQCMIYVDLNPIRAALCNSLEHSDFTSVQQRVKELGNKYKKSSRINLLALDSNENTKSIKYNVNDYLELADWTGRAVIENKRGFISKEYT